MKKGKRTWIKNVVEKGERNMIKCNIVKFLKKAGLTQRELAERVGTTEASMSRYVRGDRVPKASICIKIANVLNCNVEDLYSIEQHEEPQTNFYSERFNRVM